MLLEGEGPFAVLYNFIEGDFDRELVLKASCCGKDTSSSYVAGVHFSVDDLYTFGVDKKVKGRQLWLMGTNVMRSVKKAISIVPKLVPSICSIDKNLAVIAYASGKTESSLILMQFVDNGMFALSMNDPIDVDSDDNDIEVLGATSAKGMPLVRMETAEGLSLRSGSPPWQDEEAGENIDINAGSPDDLVDIEVDDDLDVDGGEKDAFGHAIDAFGHVIAPEG